MKVRCKNCGYEWETESKKPQCPKCKKYRIEIIDESNKNQTENMNETMNEKDESMNKAENQHENHAEKSEIQTEKDELYKDVKGEAILEKPKKKPKQVKQVQSKGSKARTVINIILIIIALIMLGYFAFNMLQGTNFLEKLKFWKKKGKSDRYEEM